MLLLNKRFILAAAALIAVIRPLSADGDGAGADVAPLVEVSFHELGAYSSLCPDGQPAGSAAVAMAQAMTVWRHPSRPVGSSPIHFDAQPDYKWADIVAQPPTAATARLIWHCAVAAGTRFAPDFSTVDCLDSVAAAMVRTFSYSDSMAVLSRDGYDGDWHELILGELRQGRPVIYQAADTDKGYTHTLIIDGYDSGTRRWHANMGQGGADDGWYALEGLRLQSLDMRLSASQWAIVGLRPGEDPGARPGGIEPGQDEPDIPDEQPSLSAASSLGYSRITRVFTIVTLPEARCVVTDDQGTKRVTGRAAADGTFSFPRKQLASGRNVIEITSPDGLQTKKLTIIN